MNFSWEGCFDAAVYTLMGENIKLELMNLHIMQLELEYTLILLTVILSICSFRKLSK